MAEAGVLMAAEMAEQPAVLATLLARAAELRDTAVAVARRRPRFVLLTARGTSDHAALYAKYLAEIRLALPAGLASPSGMTLYGARPDLGGVLFLAVSQSGASPDLAESVAVARRCGAITLAVTNAAGSPVAEAAEFAVDLGAGPERAVAATKSYTAQLLALYLLLGFLGGGEDPAAAAAGVPDAAQRTLALAGAAHAAATRYRYADRLVTIGRGYAYPTALEAALKLMETCYLAAHAYSAADLLHGPVAAVDAGTPVLAVVSAGPGGRATGPVVERLRGLGADVLVAGAAAGPDGLPVPGDGLGEDLLPVLEILPLQQLAWRLALDRGADPDRPRGLAKVTRTR